MNPNKPIPHSKLHKLSKRQSVTYRGFYEDAKGNRQYRVSTGSSITEAIEKALPAGGRVLKK